MYPRHTSPIRVESCAILFISKKVCKGNLLNHKGEALVSKECMGRAKRTHFLSGRWFSALRHEAITDEMSAVTWALENAGHQ